MHGAQGSHAPAPLTADHRAAYLCFRGMPKGITSMRSLPISSIARFVDLVGSAIEAASAVSGARRPTDRNLEALGIDPRQFRAIRLR